MNKLSILSLVLIACVGCVTTESREADATLNALAWCEEMNISDAITGVSCVGTDSDADGYVTCTLNAENGERIPIECGYNLPFAFFGQNTGCKEKRVMTIAGQGGFPG